jgi:sec-independent protein translocase protein TatA
MTRERFASRVTFREKAMKAKQREVKGDVLAMIPGLPQVGGTELIILLVVILLFFGTKRIPSLARSLGGGIREFRKGASGQYEEVGQQDTVELPEEEKLRSEDQKANALAGEQDS